MPGTYTVRLRVQDGTGVWSQWSAKTFCVSTVAKPTAVITMTPPASVYTTSLISWDYKNSTDPSGKSIINAEWQGKQDIYSTPGTYTVSLRVQNSGGLWSDWVSKTFTVNASLVYTQLSNPETGWTRYDQTDSHFTYFGSYYIGTDTHAWNGSWMSVSGTGPNNGIGFKFTGTALRVIGYKNTNYSSDIRIVVDGREYSFSQYGDPTLYGDHSVFGGYRNLNFELLDLPSTEHSVVLYNNASGAFMLDAVDLKSDGALIAGTKPTAVITMAPSESLTVNSIISWSFSDSTDSDGSRIVKAEWQGKQETYPTAGTYTVQLRVQAIDGIWSDWVPKTFTVAAPSNPLVYTQLASPSTGWTRYEDTDSRIHYSGSFSRIADVYASNGAYTGIGGTGTSNSIQFRFTGTAFRVIGYRRMTYSPDVRIVIDGQAYTFSQYGNMGTYGGYKNLNFEATNLTNATHTVTIYNNSSGSCFMLDAIDLPSDAVLSN